MPLTIRLFVTGGTFDKEYDEIHEALSFTDTHIAEVLKRGRSRVPCEVRTLMLIDSLNMTDADRETIADQCARASEDHIVITHGTGTMVETAKVIQQRVTGKTIVLTGAMIPYIFGSSDGLFNLGAALAFVQAQAPGVYIAMNGICFSADNVRKNTKTGYFEARMA